MTTFTKTIALLAFIFVTVGTSFGQVSKTVVSMFTMEEATEIELLMASADVEIRETKGSRMLVETTVKLEAVDNVRLLDFIVDGGRYNLSQQNENGKVTIATTGKNDVLIVKGEQVVEKVTYVVFVPASINIVKANGSIVQ